MPLVLIHTPWALRQLVGVQHDFFHQQLFRADQGQDGRKGGPQRETSVGELESALYVHNMVANSNIPRGPDVATGASFLGNQRQKINLTWSEPSRCPNQVVERDDVQWGRGCKGHWRTIQTTAALR